MIKEFNIMWEKNKDKLEEYLKTHEQKEYDSYENLVKLLFDIVINPECDKHYSDKFLTDDIDEIDHGNYEGIVIFILHKDTYEPSISDYVYTHVYYGSCSGCDTLQGIHHYEEGLPNEDQVRDYMTLCLHLLQNCKCMGFYEENEVSGE